MVQGYASQGSAFGGHRTAGGRGDGYKWRRAGDWEECPSLTAEGCKDNDLRENDQRAASEQTQHVMPRASGTRGKSVGAMLNVSGLNRFFYLRDFHDMRCKYDRVRSIIRQQLDRESETCRGVGKHSPEPRRTLLQYDARRCCKGRHVPTGTAGCQRT